VAQVTRSVHCSRDARSARRRGLEAKGEILILRALTLCVFLVSAQFANAQVLQLITEDEAKLPPPAAGLPSRGVTRGPGIKIDSPDPSGKLANPFALKVSFVAHGGSKIDPDSIKVTYLKSPLVDLTPRIKGAIAVDGIDVPKASVPPGEHKIRISVKDSDGRQNSEIVTLNVAK
jgi:hypothetical protein